MLSLRATWICCPFLAACAQAVGCGYTPCRDISTKPNGRKPMEEKLKFYIDGKWVDPVTPKTEEVINPANEEPFAKISLGSKADVDKAVAAARRAFETFSR